MEGLEGVEGLDEQRHANFVSIRVMGISIGKVDDGGWRSWQVSGYQFMAIDPNY